MRQSRAVVDHADRDGRSSLRSATMTVVPDPLPHPVTRRLFTSPVPPGSGWPDDRADASTPVARSAAEVTDLATAATLDEVTARSSVCRACPRLVAWREEIGRASRRE